MPSKKHFNSRRRHGGEVIVLSAGPERVGTTIREALAKGADRAIQVESDDLDQLDALGVAQLLATAAKTGESRPRPHRPAVRRSRLRPDRRHHGRTAWASPHASLILNVEKTDSGITVKRELEEGWFQNIELPFPPSSPSNPAAPSSATPRSWASRKPRQRSSAKSVLPNSVQASAPAATARKNHPPAKTEIHADHPRLRQRSRGRTR